MTKEQEQAIKNLESFIDHFHTNIKQAEKANDCAFDFTQAEDDIITFGIAIQAIKDFDKMQDVLDNIRVEIQKLPDINPDYPMDRRVHICKGEALYIIDKYRGESKDADSN